MAEKPRANVYIRGLFGTVFLALAATALIIFGDASPWFIAAPIIFFVGITIFAMAGPRKAFE
ncbi:hypothetical protein ACT3S7_15150 [Corynebacterium sp. AOP34-AQ2-28]|uniref:hypothetical protein n=1 Tax=unclassified Corynebacterium TaxID=2624378 RepID=UPI0040337799